MVTVIALLSFSPDGSRRYAKGERFQISKKSAVFLAKLGKVRIVDEPDKKKTYSRRDLRAED